MLIHPDSVGAEIAPTAEPAILQRAATSRTYLMCRPEFFEVTYAINAWMDPGVRVDTDLAISQWETLRSTYEGLGHTVHALTPEPGLPDMVFAANGAFSVGGAVYGARFAFPQRAAEATAHARWYAANGWPPVTTGEFVNEGEGDFTYVPGPKLVLAGHGFRTDRRAHDEARTVLDRKVVSLELVDPRFYHLDTALFVLDDTSVCYYPAAFSEESQRTLAALFPTEHGSVLAAEADALAFGLNAVSDGRHVILPADAQRLGERLADAGYLPIPIEDSELRKAGGSAKCCTAELRGD